MGVFERHRGGQLGQQGWRAVYGARRRGAVAHRDGQTGSRAARARQACQACQLQIDAGAAQGCAGIRLGTGGAKQGLDGGFAQSLGPGEVGQGRHVGQGRVGGDDAELIAQRHHLQTGRRWRGAGKGLPLELEHLAVENAGKFAALGARIGPRAGAG